MKKLNFVLFAICLTFISCNNDDDDSKENDIKKLEKMHEEIITASLVNSEPCADPANWDFTALGNKACGGDATYIVYAKKIDKGAFLAKVKAYTTVQIAFDIKYGVLSTCDITIPPIGVECVDGKPKLFYKNPLFN